MTDTANKKYEVSLEKVHLKYEPDCFVRFVHFIRRDTRDYDAAKHKPIVKINNFTLKSIQHGNAPSTIAKKAKAFDVASDILSCGVSKTKTSPAGTFNVVLASADINYHHIIHPGDHAIIWMRRDRVYPIKKNGTKIDKSIANNKVDSGLKMYGIVTDVRRVFQTMPNGKKLLRYRISGIDFSYFLSLDVYYHSQLADQLKDFKVFQATAVGLTSAKDLTPDVIVKELMKLFLGLGPSQMQKGTAERSRVVNDLLVLPSDIQEVFDASKIKSTDKMAPYTRSTGTFTDILVPQLGIAQYDKGDIEPKKLLKLSGFKILNIGVGTAQPLWSILKSYSNRMLNEMFVDLKVKKVGDEFKLFPTFVLRQIPFTSSAAKIEFKKRKKLDTTSFIELPSIKIPERCIINESIGRSEHERFNLIEIFGYGLQPGVFSLGFQTGFGNYAIDKNSVRRHGPRTMIDRSDFHYPAESDRKKHPSYGSLIPIWINLLADWWLGMHMYETGTFELIGVQEPLSIGDNLYIIREAGTDEIYHIESYEHMYKIEPSVGKKSFRTVVKVTRGQRVDEYPVYASGRIDENSQLDIGLSDTEFEGTARASNAVSEKQDAAIAEVEVPKKNSKTTTKGKDTKENG